MNINRNDIFNTFKGGWQYNLIDFKDYMCCYRILRFCKGHPNGKLKVPGVYYSMHVNTWHDNIKLPKFLKYKSHNFHIIFIKKFPFVVCGFNNVSKYVEWF